MVLSCLEGLLTWTPLFSGHEEVDGACGAETRGLGEGVTSCKLHAGVSGK